MYTPKAVIVSDISLVCAALSKALSDSFPLIQSIPSVSALQAEEDWRSVVLILDVPDPSEAISSLHDIASRVDLDRTILLLRSTQRSEQFKDLVGRVGAILPSTCTVEAVVLVSKLMGHGLRLLPADMLMPAAPQPRLPRVPLGKQAVLTERERAVLALIAEGNSNKAIARKLDLSDSTVRVHVRSLLRKLGLQNRTQAALLAHTM